MCFLFLCTGMLFDFVCSQYWRLLQKFQSKCLRIFSSQDIIKMEAVEDSNILYSHFQENFKLPRVVLWNENLCQCMPVKQKLYQVILATPKIIGSHAGQTKIVYQVVLVRLKICHTKCCRTSITTFIKIILIVYCPSSVEGKIFVKPVDGNSVQFTVHIYNH